MKQLDQIVKWTAAFLATGLISTQAQTISQWDFNSNPADASTSTGISTPSIGAGTISFLGGVTSTFAGGSPGDPAAGGNDNSGLNLTTWAAQGAGSGTRGLQVAVSTVGFANISISLDFRQSGTVSRFFQLQASTDGLNFNDVSGGSASLGVLNNNTGTSFTSAGLYSNNPGGGSQTYAQAINYVFAAGSAYENNPNFAFRWVAVFDPANGANYISANAGTTTAYAATGTGRFDMVTVASVVPEPTAFALGALGLLGIMFRKRAGAHQ